MKIILIRHAKVEVDIYTLTYASELNKWLDIYNTTKIKTELVNEKKIRKIFEETDKIFCSKLKRSIDSVALYGKTPDISDEVFNEAGVPFSNWRGIKLPLVIWSIVFRVMWLFGYKNNGESYKEAKLRAKKGTDKLIESSEKEATVTLLGHGLMNRLIGKELVRRGWKSQGKMGSDNWDYGLFELEEEKIHFYDDLKTRRV